MCGKRNQTVQQWIPVDIQLHRNNSPVLQSQGEFNAGKLP